MSGANGLCGRGCLLPAVRGACPGVWGLGAEGGGEGDSSILFSFGLFLKVTEGSFTRNTAAV